MRKSINVRLLKDSTVKLNATEISFDPLLAHLYLYLALNAISIFPL